MRDSILQQIKIKTHIKDIKNTIQIPKMQRKKIKMPLVVIKMHIQERKTSIQIVKTLFKKIKNTIVIFKNEYKHKKIRSKNRIFN